MIESYEFVLLGLCLWATGATGLAFMYWRRFEMSKFIIMALGKDLAQVARGDLEIRIVGNQITRKYKEKTNA